jgi:hypothetical protein
MSSDAADNLLIAKRIMDRQPEVSVVKMDLNTALLLVKKHMNYFLSLDQTITLAGTNNIITGMMTLDALNLEYLLGQRDKKEVKKE